MILATCTKKISINLCQCVTGNSDRLEIFKFCFHQSVIALLSVQFDFQPNRLTFLFDCKCFRYFFYVSIVRFIIFFFLYRRTTLNGSRLKFEQNKSSSMVSMYTTGRRWLLFIIRTKSGRGFVEMTLYIELREEFMSKYWRINVYVHM